MIKISGQRGGYCYQHNGYLYNKKNNNDHVFYCTSRTGKFQCPGKVILFQDSVLIKVEHNHTQNAFNLSEKAEKDQIYSKSRESIEGLKQIFDDFRIRLVIYNFIYKIMC